MLFQVRLHQLRDLFRILIRHQTERELHERLLRDHRLRSLALEATADTIDLRRWSRPATLRIGKAWLAEQLRRSGEFQRLKITLRHFQPLVVTFTLHLHILKITIFAIFSPCISGSAVFCLVYEIVAAQFPGVKSR